MNETKLYVGGLSYRCSNAELREAFEKAGAVEDAAIVLDRETQRSRGFGFVTMADAAAAQAAIEMWHEQEHMGRTLIVNLAKPKSH